MAIAGNKKIRLLCEAAHVFKDMLPKKCSSKGSGSRSS